MIQLTDEQILAVKDSGDLPLEIEDPRSREKFVILKRDAFLRLNEPAYDDSPSTREEREMLNWETAERSGGEDYSDVVTP